MIVGPSRQELCDFRPPVAVFFVQPNDREVFFLRPLVLLNVWVQMIVPALATLLSNSAWECCCYITPVLWTVQLDIFREFFIFFLTPRPFHHRWIQHFLPSVQALDVCSVVQMRGNLLPIFCAKLVD